MLDIDVTISFSRISHKTPKSKTNAGVEHASKTPMKHVECAIYIMITPLLLKMLLNLSQKSKYRGEETNIERSGLEETINFSSLDIDINVEVPWGSRETWDGLDVGCKCITGKC